MFHFYFALWVHLIKTSQDQNQVPWEFYDAKPPIQMSQRHPQITVKIMLAV